MTASVEQPHNLTCQRIAHAVKHLPPAYFALVMATGIVSIAARDFQFPFLAMGLFAVNLVAYAVPG